jgi:hypothetical protein
MEGRKDGRTDGRTDSSVTISLRNFVGEGIKKLLEINEKQPKKIQMQGNVCRHSTRNEEVSITL